MPKYLKIAEKEKALFDFYKRSLDSFDRIFTNTEQEFGKFINENGKVLSGRYAYIILQTKNAIDFFFGHYFILKNGLCNASIPSLRYCYETLLKNYFYLTLPYGEKDLIKYHTYKVNRFRNSLYTSDALSKSHNILYDKLSDKSHVNIVSSSPSYKCSKIMYKDSLETGAYILHGHYIFILECFNQFISQDDRKKIKRFFGEFAHIFRNTSSSFIPNKDKTNSFLKFRNVGLVTPENVDLLKRDEKSYLDQSISYNA